MGVVRGKMEMGSASATPAWWKAYQPMNHDTMYHLQLHPLFRGGSGLLFLMCGIALYIVGDHEEHDCGEGFVPLVSVCGVYLLFAGVVGCGVAAVRYNQTANRGGANWKDGAPVNPAVEWLVLDWLCSTLLLFIL